MTEIAKSDAFFFITSIAVVVIGILAISFIIYSFFIVRKIKKLVDKVKEEGEEVIEDVREFRLKLKEERGFLGKIPSLFILLNTLFKKHKHKKNHD